MPCFSASPERGRTWTSWPCGISIAKPVATACRLPGLQRQIFSRDDVKPGGMLRRIFGQRQAFAVGQARQLDFDHAGVVPVLVREGKSRRCS